MRRSIKWLLPDWRYEVSRRIENLLFKIVWALPRKIVYLCGIRLWAHASSGKWEKECATDVTLEQMFNRWEQPR
jgi:hypothetical protein